MAKIYSVFLGAGGTVSEAFHALSHSHCRAPQRVTLIIPSVHLGKQGHAVNTYAELGFKAGFVLNLMLLKTTPILQVK